MPKTPNNFNPFPFLDRDPEAVGDQMARSMTRDEAEAAIEAARVWIDDVSQGHSAARWKREESK